jgi:hypothetical protein
VVVYERGMNGRDLVAYDLGSGREVWDLAQSTNTDEVITGVAAAAGGVVMTTPSKAYFQPSDGSPLSVLFELEPGWEQFEHVAASPDGRLLAVSVDLPPQPVGTPLPGGGQAINLQGAILFYDLAQRRQVSLVAGNGETGLSEGPTVWRDDGTGILLRSYTHSERPGPISTVFLDGRVVPHELQGFQYIAPNGRLILHGIGDNGCLAIADHQMYVRDADTGRDVVQVHNDQQTFTGWDWSPDSSEFLFVSRPADEAKNCQIGLLPETTLLLSAKTGVVSAVPSLEALYRRWYGEALVWMDCEGEFVPLQTGTYESPYAYCESQAGGFGKGTLHYRTLTIDSSEFFHLIGFVR